MVGCWHSVPQFDRKLGLPQGIPDNFSECGFLDETCSLVISKNTLPKQSQDMWLLSKMDCLISILLHLCLCCLTILSVPNIPSESFMGIHDELLLKFLKYLNALLVLEGLLEPIRE